MDWLTFAAEMMKALVWPATALIAVILLREPLFRLLRELKRLKWSNLEVKFDKEVVEVRTEARKTLPKAPLPPRSSDINDFETRLLNLVEVAPKAAVLDAWVEVEKEVLSLFRRKNISIESSPRVGPLGLAEALRRNELRDDHHLWLFNSLRQLRNTAAYEREEEVTEAGALQYISMASDLIRALRA